MDKKHETERAIRLLESGISKIKNFGNSFVPYNTKFLGFSTNGEYTIKGKSTEGSTALNEFCYGRDEDYGAIHILPVYQMKNGIKYAVIERSISLYAIWEILD